MPSTSTPRKRQILPPSSQSQITSFFTPTTGTHSHVLPQTAPPSLTSAPQLPDSVQAGLLAVGMRVRKAVPEGLKSGTYAFNKHLPGVGVSGPGVAGSEAPAQNTSEERKSKRRQPFDEEDEKVRSALVPAPPVAKASAKGGNTGRKGMFWKAVKRRDYEVVKVKEVEFGEAEFLKPVEDVMEF